MSHDFTGLAMTAQATLALRFDEYGHVPSTQQWAAIRDLLEHLERSAHGNVRPAVYLSAIPPGAGKSTALTAFAEALMDHTDHTETGMLIACNRVQEVYDFAKELLPYRDRICVLIGTDRAVLQDGEMRIDVRSMGGQPDPSKAQLILTTQAKLKRALKDSPEAMSGPYGYLGGRREVVCWDESISFNRPVVINAFAATGLANAARRQSKDAALALVEWVVTVAKAPSGTSTVPDFTALGLDFDRLEDDVSHDDDLAAQAKALSTVSGGKAFSIQDNSGSALVSYVPELPDSILPLTVTDASAAQGVRHGAYEQMSRTKTVIRLLEAHKTYHNLTIRVVPTAASRSVYRDRNSTKGRELIEMAVRYIRSVAPADVLVVSYKNHWPMKGVDERTIANAIDARLTPEERFKVKHITWGQHTATNKHTKIRHVLLMGLYFLPTTVAYAASGAAQNKSMQTDNPDDHPTEDDVDAMRSGCLRDSTLQAGLRGNARMGVNGDCGLMEIVIPMTKQTGLSTTDLEGLFPGATQRQDRTLMPAKRLTGRLAKMAEVVARLLATGVTVITNPELCEALGIARSHLSTLIKKPEWKAWTAAMGLRPATLKGNVSGLRTA